MRQIVLFLLAIFTIFVLVGAQKDSFKCNSCDRTFSNGGAALRHVKRHSEISSFPCPLCIKMYHRKDHLTRHLRAQHGSHRQCKSCHEHFDSKLSQDAHWCRQQQSPAMGNTDLFICVSCNKTYLYSGHYRNHQKMCSQKRAHTTDEIKHLMSIENVIDDISDKPHHC